MKSTDRRSKDDFYYAEKALNDIYTGIGQEVSVKAADSYEAAFVSVGYDNGVTVTIENSKQAEDFYKNRFVKELSKWMVNHATASGLGDYIVKDVTNDYIVSVGTPTLELYDGTIVPVVADEGGGLSFLSSVDCTKVESIRVPQVSVELMDTGKQFEATVTSDIVIAIPNMNFFGTNTDVLNYGVIANRGMIVNGNATINGNLYAGTNTASDITSGININDGKLSINNAEYIISKGDIKVGEGVAGTKKPKLEVTSTSTETDRLNTNMWFDSLRTIAGSNMEGTSVEDININANMFALNDLELNADYSTVVLQGSYYGYDDTGRSNTEVYASWEDVLKDNSKSSSIIVNGSHATLDMSGLTTLVLLGKAYMTPGDEEISTAESLAIKTNQQLYLVPTDFLECPNPTDSISETFSSLDIPNTWFGAKYLVKSGTTYEIEVKSINGARYAFLKFDDTTDYVAEMVDDGTGKLIETGTIVKEADKITGRIYSNVFKARTGYIKEIMNGANDGASPTAEQMKKRIAYSLANTTSFSLEGVTINDSSSSSSAKKNIYSKNSLAEYSVDYSEANRVDTYVDESGNTIIGQIGKADIEAVTNTAARDRYAGSADSMTHRFQWLCTRLNPWESIPILGSVDKIPEGSGAIAWEQDSDYPFAQFVDLNADGRTNAEGDVDSAYGQFLLLHDDGSGATISGVIHGVVICDGNLVIQSDTVIYGTVIAKGTITFAGNNTVSTDRAIIQKRIDKEIKEVKKDGVYRKNYLITYLIDESGDRLYEYEMDENTRIKSADEIKYDDYMYYENWRKGGTD